MRKAIIIAALAALGMLCSCHKEKTSCRLGVMPYFQDEDKGPTEVCANAGAYAFYADAAEWMVMDYEDALAGVLTSRTGQGTLRADAQATVDEDGRLVMSPLTQPLVMIVVWWADTKAYAVRQATIVPDLADMKLSVTFRVWKDAPIEEALWTVTNQQPPITVNCDVVLSMKVQPGSDPLVLEPVALPVAYAYYADTAAWKPASLADALLGKLTAASGTGTRTYDFQAQEGTFFQGLTRRRVMLLAVDEPDRSYAFKQVWLDYGALQMADQVTFTVGATALEYENNGWRVVREAVPAPDPDPTP